MKFEVKLTKEYLLDFHMKYFLKTKTFLALKITYVLLMMTVWASIYFIVDTKYELMIIIMFLIYMLLLIVFKKRLNTRLAKNQILSYLNDYKNKFLFSPIIITIDDNGFSINTESNTKLIEWNIIENFYIIENNIIIKVFGDKNNIFIPSECFNNKCDLDILIELFKENPSIYPQYRYPNDIKFR